MSNDYFWRENSNKSFLVEFEFSRQNKEKKCNEIIQVFWRENSNKFCLEFEFSRQNQPFSRIFIVFYHKVN